MNPGNANEQIGAGSGPLRVTLVAPLPPPTGGIAKWTEALLVHAVGDPEVEFIHVCSAQRLRPMLNLALPARISSGVVLSVGLFASFARALLTKHSHVVHMTTSGHIAFLRDMLFIGLARLLGRPTVLHIRGGRLPEAVTAGKLEAKLAKWTFWMSGAVIVLDAASAEAVQRLVPNCRVSVIPNPAWKLGEAQCAPATPNDVPVVLFVGWVIPAKGVRELVRACVDIVDVPFRLEMLGIVKEEIRDELKEIASARGGGRWLNIPGEVSAAEVAAAISGAAMLVLPSYTEGAPNVVLETMALGAPVIATPVGAVPEMLAFGTDSPCGLNVPIRDVDALREAIRRLLSDRKLAEQLGNRARERALLEYSPGRVVAKYKAVWRETAGIRMEPLEQRKGYLSVPGSCDNARKIGRERESAFPEPQAPYTREKKR